MSAISLPGLAKCCLFAICLTFTFEALARPENEEESARPPKAMICEASLTAPTPEHLIGAQAEELGRSQKDFVLYVEAVRDKLAQSRQIGRFYTVEESVALVASFLEPEVGHKFIEDWWSRLGNIPIDYRDVPLRRGRLIYKPRFVDFRIRRSLNARLRWSNQVVQSAQDLEDLVEATINTFAESAFIPIRRYSVYLRSPNLFLRGNLLIMKEKLLYRMFALGPQSAGLAPGWPRAVPGGLFDLLRTTLPFQFYLIRELKLNQAHVQAFERGGAQALYDHLKWREGVTLAVRYWFVHWTNLKAVIVLSYLAALAPSVMEARQYFANLSTLQLSSTDQFERARRIYEAMRRPSDEAMAIVRREIQKLSPEERRAIEDILDRD